SRDASITGVQTCALPISFKHTHTPTHTHTHTHVCVLAQLQTFCNRCALQVFFLERCISPHKSQQHAHTQTHPHPHPHLPGSLGLRGARRSCPDACAVLWAQPFPCAPSSTGSACGTSAWWCPRLQPGSSPAPAWSGSG